MDFCVNLWTSIVLGFYYVLYIMAADEGVEDGEGSEDDENEYVDDMLYDDAYFMETEDIDDGEDGEDVEEDVDDSEQDD